MDNDVATFTPWSKMRAAMQRASDLGFEVHEEPADWNSGKSPVVSIRYRCVELARFNFHTSLSIWLNGVEAERKAAAQRLD